MLLTNAVSVIAFPAHKTQELHIMEVSVYYPLKWYLQKKYNAAVILNRVINFFVVGDVIYRSNSHEFSVSNMRSECIKSGIRYHDKRCTSVDVI